MDGKALLEMDELSLTRSLANELAALRERNREMEGAQRKRQAAEESLRDGTSHYRRLIEAVTDYIYTVEIVDGEAVGTTHGHNCAAITGYTPEEYADDPTLWLAMVHPDDRQAVLEATARMCAGIPVCSFEHRILHKDGSVRWVRNTPVSHCDPAQRVIVYNGLISDITERKQAEEALRESERRFREMLGNARLASVMLGPDGAISFCNDYLLQLTGWRWEELSGRDWFETFLPPDKREEIRTMFFNTLHTGDIPPHYENVILTRQGERRLIAWNNMLLRGENGTVTGTASIGEDISHRRRAEEALRESEHSYRTLSENLPGIVYRVFLKENSRTQFFNTMLEDLTGYRPEELATGRVCSIEPLILPADRKCVAHMISNAIATGIPFQVEYRLRHKNGEIRHLAESGRPVPGRDGKPLYIDGVIFDITERKQFEEQLLYQANYDFVTGLPNRNLLHDRLSHAIAHESRHKRKVAVLLLDLDQFKIINDTMGHPAGDQILKEAALRLKRCKRTSDTVARLGGDEFVLIMTDIGHLRNVARIAEKVLKVFAPPFSVQGQEIFVTCSAGIAMFPDDGTDADVLLKNADVAMYHAKKLGRNNYQFFTGEMNARVHRQLVLENSLRKAQDRGEFTLHYQPLVDLASGTVVGAEALLRWQRGDEPLAYPAEFIPLLEDTGLIVPVGEWVFHEACRQNRIWQDRGVPPLSVSVNISGRQFYQKNLPEQIGRILDKSGLEPHHLKMELTESLLMQDVDEVVNKLDRLKAMGVLISIDDFGTGYSSLSYLKRFAIDELKIDRSFTSGLTADPNDVAIVTAIIAMAHSLNLKVVAEGVETREQLDFLTAHGCEAVQGYFFSKPLPADDFERFLGIPQQLAIGGNG